MEYIKLPDSIYVKASPDSPNKGTVIIESLYPGYGHTIVNALRRVLLSSLSGGAVYAFKIKGIKHEFSTIDYVKEDVVDISLNLKRVNLKCFSTAPIQLELKAEGQKEVKASDISKNSEVEIANPDQRLLTLTDKAASIDMTLWARQGSGYSPVEGREDDDLEVGAIAIDSIYTPIRQVGYTIDNVRVGKRTDYDKIIMDIETNGTIGVKEAVAQASKILADHFSLISEKITIGSDPEDNKDNNDSKNSTDVDDAQVASEEPK